MEGYSVGSQYEANPRLLSISVQMLSGATLATLEVMPTTSVASFRLLLAASGVDDSRLRLAIGAKMLRDGDERTLAEVGLDDSNGIVYAVRIPEVVLAVVHSDGAVRIWSTENEHCKAAFHGYDDRASTVALSRSGALMAVGSYNSDIKIWNAVSGELLLPLQGHRACVYAVVFSSDEERLVSGSADCSLKLWNLQTGRCERTFQGHRNIVRCVAMSPDEKFMASGSTDTTLRLWSTSASECLKILGKAIQRQWVRCVAFSSNGELLASGFIDGVLRIFDVESGKQLFQVIHHNCSLNSVAFASDQPLLALGADDGSATLWCTETYECTMSFPSHASHGMRLRVESVDFSPDHVILATGLNNGQLKLWNVATGECEKALETGAPCCCMSLSVQAH